MILFVCEGRKREPHLLEVINRFFLSTYGEEENCIVVFGCHIQSLASLVEERSRDFPEISLEDSVDLVALLKEQRKDSPIDAIHKIKDSSDVREIYLFFDCDLHDLRQDRASQLNRIKGLLTLFDNERTGMLYLSYPMIEALCYTQALPDDHFSEYVCRIDACSSFKEDTRLFSHYKNQMFVGAIKPPRGNDTKSNWCSLIRQHRRKAQELCGVSTGYTLTQRELFQAQCDKHIIPRGEVAILASMPLFLYDYFSEAKRKELGFSLAD